MQRRYRELNPEHRRKQAARQKKAWRNRTYPDGRRWLHLQAKYGISQADYEAMSEAQGGVCAICRKPETMGRKDRGGNLWLAVDHCAETGVVRGLLCGNCNRGIGSLKHDPQRLASALDYLKGDAK